MQLTHCLKRALSINPNGPICVRADGTQRSYREGVDRISRLAAGLQSLGVKQGERVGILSLNSEFYFESTMAAVWAGAVYVPLNWRLTPRELAFVMNDAGVSVMFVDSANYTLSQKIKPRPSQWVKTILIGDKAAAGNNVVEYEELIRSSQPVQCTECNSQDLVSLNFTAGTTSRSKGVMLSHDNMFFNAVNTLAGLGMTSEVAVSSFWPNVPSRRRCVQLTADASGRRPRLCTTL